MIAATDGVNTKTTVVNIRLMDLVGISGDTQAIEGELDNINLVFMRYTADNHLPMTIPFKLDLYSDLNWSDFVDDEGKDILSRKWIEIPAGSNTVTLTLRANSDNIPELHENLDLTVKNTPDYTVVKPDTAALTSLFDVGTYSYGSATLSVYDAFAVFVNGIPGDPDDGGSVDLSDIRQGGVGDCYFWCAVAAAVHKDPSLISGLISLTRQSDGTYPVSLYVNGELTPFYVQPELVRGFDQTELSGDYITVGNVDYVEIWNVLL